MNEKFERDTTLLKILTELLQVLLQHLAAAVSVEELHHHPTCLFRNAWLLNIHKDAYNLLRAMQTEQNAQFALIFIKYFLFRKKQLREFGQLVAYNSADLYPFTGSMGAVPFQ